MTLLSRRKAVLGSCGLIAGVAMLWTANCLQAAPPDDIEEPEGLVWFIGTVEQVVDGVPLIDLGEVHTLRAAAEGEPFRSKSRPTDVNDLYRRPRESTVAAIRNRDNHFSPLGVMEVSFSNPTWSQMKKPTSFTPEIGDLVMFVESPGNLGSGDAIRDAFIRHRIVANSSGNRYSTVRCHRSRHAAACDRKTAELGGRQSPNRGGDSITIRYQRYAHQTQTLHESDYDVSGLPGPGSQCR
ncbi:MAG: hypothetical protein WKF77_14205 [Planctomycetaceae bacterium]